MKSVLLYANDDSGLESRLQAALDMVRLFEGHLTCLQVTPFDGFIMSDPFGGIYALPTVLEQVRKAEDEHRGRIEGRLRSEGISWDWLREDGSPAQMVTDRSRLCDLIVLSLAGERGGAQSDPLSLAADVAVHARAPVLAVPHSSRSINGNGTALVAWNGSPESCHALRLALPMLTKAATVHIATVVDDRTEFPATDGCQYLARHGITAELHEWPKGDRSTSAALLDAAGTLRADYLVMGAYGHARLREAILGGTTRDMLVDSRLPLLLAH